MPKLKKFKCDILSIFQTICNHWNSNFRAKNVKKCAWRGQFFCYTFELFLKKLTKRFSLVIQIFSVSKKEVSRISHVLGDLWSSNNTCDEQFSKAKKPFKMYSVHSCISSRRKCRKWEIGGGCKILKLTLLYNFIAAHTQ